jgi:hypothetical protein
VQPVIKASNANVLLVPSLSQKTTAHETAAKEYRAAFLGSTFVCNRKTFPDNSPERTGSFFLVPRKGTSPEYHESGECHIFQLFTGK